MPDSFGVWWICGRKALVPGDFRAWPLYSASDGKIGFRLLSTKVNPSAALSVHAFTGIGGLQPRIWRFQTVVQELTGHGVPRQLEIKQDLGIQPMLKTIFHTRLRELRGCPHIERISYRRDFFIKLANFDTFE